MNKVNKRKKEESTINLSSGITLIALVVTIVVLLILAGITINMLFKDNGIITKAQEAAQKTDDAAKKENYIFGTSEDTIDKLAGPYKEKILTLKTIVGQNGVITFPEKVNLNDCKYFYKLDIESNLYTGEILLNVYGTEENYAAIANVQDGMPYGYEFRDIMNSTFEEENMIMYEGRIEDGKNVCMLQYDPEEFGSEITIRKVTACEKEYREIGNAIIKLYNAEDLTLEEIMEFVQYCSKLENLGYEYVNETEGKELFNETKEKALLKKILEKDKENIEAITKAIRDQIIYSVNAIIESSGKNSELKGILTSLFTKGNPYTVADYIEENKYIAELYTRVIGNTIVPFNILFLDVVLEDLNEEGLLRSNTLEDGTTTEKNASKAEYFNEINGYAGAIYRAYADMFGSVLNYHDIEEIEGLGEKEKLYITEIDAMQEVLPTQIAVYWYMLGSLYDEYNLDYIYSLIYNEGIKINYAGLRIGYYSCMLPEFSKIWSESVGINFDDEYNPLEDTEYLEKQGIVELMQQMQ